MVDPKSQAVWHMDYTDHVDEETLCASFEDFLQHINFNLKIAIHESPTKKTLGDPLICGLYEILIKN